MPKEDRVDILLRSVARDVEYIDPSAKVSGLLALSEHIAAVVSERPGSTVLRTSQVDVHHELARFSWHLKLGNGEVLPEGIDLVEIGPDTGKLSKIIGFFGSLSPLENS